MTSPTEQAPTVPSFHDLMKRCGTAFDAYDLDLIMKHYHTPCFIYKDGDAIFLSDDARKKEYFEDLLGRLRVAGVHH